MRKGSPIGGKRVLQDLGKTMGYEGPVLTGSIEKMSPEEPSGFWGWEGVDLVHRVGEKNPRGDQ